MTKQKKISLLSMIFLSLNGILGVGLFLLPGQVAAIVGSWSLVLYGIVALMVMAIGWCYVQCARHFSQNGGVYLYATEAFGRFVGFEVGIMRWSVGLISWASLTAAFITSLGILFPVLAEPYIKESLIIGVISCLCCMNIFGAAVIERMSNLITLLKVVLLVGFVLVGSIAMDVTEIPTLLPLPEVSTFGSAALLIFYAFSGFEALTIAANDMENPQRNLPLAIMTAIGASSLLYFIVQLICIATLGDDLATSHAPIADIAYLMAGDMGKFLVSIAVLISIGGVIVASSFFTPRVVFAMGASQQILSGCAKQNRFASPYVACLISSVIVCLITLSATFVQLITISVVCRFVQHSITCLALFAFERKGIMRPFSHPWKKAIPIFALASIAWLASHAEGYQLLCGALALGSGAVLYGVQQYYSTTPHKRGAVE